MKKNKLDKVFWEGRYTNNTTGWDLLTISSPIKTYIDQLKNKNQHILIPGAGNAYEAEYLWHKGYRNVWLVDIAQTPLSNFLLRVPEFPKSQCLNIDFFELDQKFDLILEQTFFCALEPRLRNDYVLKMHDLLNKNGKLVGLLFDFELTESGPPFGGNEEMYRNYFSNTFNIKTMERAYNSDYSRANKELFFIFEKKDSCL